MKSSQLLAVSKNPVAPRARRSINLAALFGAALSLGFVGSSVIAQGPYYPGTPNIPPGTAFPGSSFAPNGAALQSSPTLALIESYLVPPTVTLTNLPYGTRTAIASDAQYAAAVQLVAQQLDANGGSIGSVNFATLGQTLAKYRSSTSTVYAALSAATTGIINSNANAQASLESLVYNVAKANPVLLSAITPPFSAVYQAAAANNSLVGGVKNLVAQTIQGALNATPGTSTDTVGSGVTTSIVATYGISQAILGGMSAIGNSTVASAATPALKNGLRQGLVNRIIGVDVGVTDVLLKNSIANLDAAAQGLTSPGVLSLGGGTNLTTMLGYIKAAAASALPTPPTTSADERDGAIVQGTIRNGVNAGVYTELFAAFSGAGNYGHDLAYAHQNYPAAYSLLATQNRLGDPGGPNAAAITAAGTLKFPGSQTVVAKDVLNTLTGPAYYNGPVPATAMPGYDAESIIKSGVGAAPSNASAIAGSLVLTGGLGGAAVGGANVTAAVVARYAIAAAPVSSAGAIAQQIIIKATLSTLAADIKNIGDGAITGAAEASPSNKQEGYADVAKSLEAILRSGSLSQNQEAAKGMVAAAENQTPGLGYIPLVAQMANSLNAYHAALNTLAPTIPSISGNAVALAAINKTKLMLDGIFTGNGLLSYSKLLDAADPLKPNGATTATDRLAMVTAAEINITNDPLGQLAAFIKRSASPAEARSLIAAAVSAARSQQSNLSIGGDVAMHLNDGIWGGNPNDIQAYLGAQYARNPSSTTAITQAATAIAPKYSHVVAHSLAFNNPTNVTQEVLNIFVHSQISYGTNVQDRPAAVAAISAGLTTGILENTLGSNAYLSVAATKTAIAGMVYNLTIAAGYKGSGASSYDDKRAVGAPLPGSLLENKGSNFRRFNPATGLPFPAGASAYVPAVAGGVTGFVAQMVKPGDSDIDLDGNGLVAVALKTVAQFTGLTYAYDIAQAAAQAYGWVSTQTVSPAAASSIANAVYSGLPGQPASVLTALTAAANFGISEAKGGVVANGALPGAGAEGLRNGIAKPYYDHHSTQGEPVSNIFNL